MSLENSKRVANNNSPERYLINGSTPKVIIPQNVLDEIEFLCRSISNVEWSGVLFYRAEGTIEDPGNMVFTLEEVFPMDKGDTGTTAYSFDDPKLTQRIMDKPELMIECKLGHIHSHHNMSVFFSGTDMDELDDNSENHNYYLSLIVNNKGEMTCKLCYRAVHVSSEIILTAAGDNGGTREIKMEPPVKKNWLMHMNCDIELPVGATKVRAEFVDRLKEVVQNKIEADRIAAQKKAASTNKTAPPKGAIGPFQPKYNPSPVNGDSGWGDYPESYGSIGKTLTDLEEVEDDTSDDIYEVFLAFMLNKGMTPDLIKENPDVANINTAAVLERQIEEITVNKIKSSDIAKDIMDNYAEYHVKFFKEECDMDDLIYSLDEIMSLLAYYADTSETVTQAAKLTSIQTQLEVYQQAIKKQALV